MKLKRKVKTVIWQIFQKILPEYIFFELLAISSRLRAVRARKAFEQASETPVWLGRDALESLQQEYPPRWTPSYDPYSLEKRGKEQARRILGLIRSETRKYNTYLELGCGDGMVSCILQRNGKITTAIDIRADKLDPRAENEGVTFIHMDATHLEFDDASFDFVFSYNSFEHFKEPGTVLQEAIRVARVGGYIYIAFDPLYMAPWGLHAYRIINVPYCQLLFPKELLQGFAKAKGLGTMDFGVVNGWSLEDYRRLWNRYASRLRRVRYYEVYDVSALDLIARYPSCFKSKTKHFDDLIVSRIEALFQKTR
jgi:SAM-dependent methyltransferase